MVKLSRKPPQQAAISEEDSSATPSQDTLYKNVVVFGESGVGKSSLVNLIAGEKICETSSGALGCTLEYKRHPVVLDDQHFAIWDTAGLDEGTQGSVPADKAEAYLKHLLHELAKNKGVDLLVYCVRGTRVRTALLTNYHIFYSAICRKKVPIAIVITGLENQEGNMDTWWYRNGPQFSQLKMHFDGYACVTTLESSIDHPLLMERQEISRRHVIQMIKSTCRAQQWNPPERGWVESAYSDIRAMLSPSDDYGARLTTIIMCDTTRKRRADSSRLTRKRSSSIQVPVALPSSPSSRFSFRNPFSNDTFRGRLPFEEGIKYTPERLHRVYQVSPKPPPLHENSEEIRKAPVVKRGADLLIFCAGVKESEIAKFQWEHFYSTYGGDLSPQIILIVGAANQSTAEEWWRGVVGEAVAGNGFDVAHWPMGLDATRNEAEVARRRLQDLISDRCIDCGKAALTKDEKLFRRSLLLNIASLATCWAKTEGAGQGDESPTDILTEVGVWYDIPDSEHSSSRA